MGGMEFYTVMKMTIIRNSLTVARLKRRGLQRICLGRGFRTQPGVQQHGERRVQTANRDGVSLVTVRVGLCRGQQRSTFINMGD
jgi:hypothetical protein